LQVIGSARRIAIVGIDNRNAMSSKRRPKGGDPADSNVREGVGLQLETLRLKRGVTQIALAEIMNIRQSALSHLERRSDILLSTMIDYVGAMGGTLHIEAKFSDGQRFKLRDGQTAPSAAVATDQDEDSSKQLALPIVLGPEQQPPSRDVLFSIRPAHAEKILDGSKTVELRRRFASDVRPGTLALIYSTSPMSALTGSAKIRAVQCLELSDLWETHRAAACLGKGDFETYFSGLERGYAIILDSAKPLDRPVGLPELRKRFGFEPPQSYQYASPYMRGLVENERPQTPH
jgi:predicted transcriptional regulator/transcriptional regulator with XRE-family HTH domain